MANVNRGPITPRNKGVVVESDPVFVAHDAYGITAALISDWNTAFGWGDHAGLYALVGHDHDLVYAPLSHTHVEADISDLQAYLTSVDAGIVTYTPGVLADWSGSADPGDVDNALDQLAARLTDEEAHTHAAPDASVVTYTPAVATDWDSDTDPGEVDNALDQLAERVDDLEAAPPAHVHDSDDVTYTPTTLTDWDSDADPGDVEQALDQLAERVDDLEAGGALADHDHTGDAGDGGQVPAAALLFTNPERIIASISGSEFAPHAMTGNSAPSPYVISAGTEYAGYNAFYAFNGVNTTPWYSTATGNPTGWIKVDLGAGNARTLGSYALTMPSDTTAATPKDWTVQGSNDDSTWTTVDTQAGITWASVPMTKSFTCDSPSATAFRYWKIVWTANNGDANYCDFGEIYLYSADMLAGTEITCTAAGRALLDDADAAAQRTTLGVPLGPSFAAHKNGSDQTYTAGSGWVKVTFGTEVFDSHGMFASNAFSPTIAGIYLISAAVRITITTLSADHGISIYKNGGPAAYNINYNTVPGGATTLALSFIFENDGNDYFEIFAYSGDSVNGTIVGDASSTIFSGCRIG